MQFGLMELQDGRASDFWWQLKSPSIAYNLGDRGGRIIQDK